MKKTTSLFNTTKPEETHRCTASGARLLLQKETRPGQGEDGGDNKLCERYHN